MSRNLQLENRPKTYLKGNRKETFLQNKKGKSVKFVQLSKLLEVVGLEKGIEEKNFQSYCKGTVGKGKFRT